MTNIELYINKKLCDIQSPDKLGIRLNRVLINPAELSTKDAQYSYSISLPASSRNNNVFGYANVEEVRNKFNVDYNAVLIVDGVTVFDGKFRMSDITATEYKGNLVVPAKKTIKEIFGDKKMTGVQGEWKLDLVNEEKHIASFPAMINKMNEAEGNPHCIFPYVLYGLMPKVSDGAGKYTAKTWFDSTVRLGIEDFPPSINCLEAIRQIFRNTKDEDGKELNISGDVFNDKRMQALYMSYKNPTDYVQPWNWGELGKMRLKGSWTNYLLDSEREDGKPYYEHLFTTHTNRNDRRVYVSDILKGRMTKIDENYSFDNGTNITRSPVKDNRNEDYEQKIITIPYSGLYKITFIADLKIKGLNSYSVVNKEGGVKFVPASFRFSSRNNYLKEKGYEIKLLRDFGDGFDYENIALDSMYYRPNLPQDESFDKTKDLIYHFPKPGNRTVQFIDPCVNQNLISGFRWGRQYDDVPSRNDSKNPLSTESIDIYNYILSIKNGWSWDVSFSQKDKIFSAINSPAYATWGRRSKVNEEGDIFIDFESQDPDANELQWINESNKFNIELTNIQTPTESTIFDDTQANGKLAQVIWLNKGERITLVSVSDQGTSESGPGGGKHGWVMHSVDFDLRIEPFKTTWDWVKVSNGGTGTESMDWNDNKKDNFVTDNINLLKFLPSDVKIDDWLDSFCKAFNLHLSQPEPGKFELNFRQKPKNNHAVIDLGGKTGMVHRINQPLGLPAVYELGFKIEKAEQGYDASSPKDDGGGRFETGTLDGQTLTQTSSFSYNWYQPIDLKGEEVDESNKPVTLFTMRLPVISNKEVWDNQSHNDTSNYAEMQKKMYSNYSQRFWFRSTNKAMYSLGKLWSKYYDSLYKDKTQEEVNVPVLSNTYTGDVSLVLNYKDEPNSILRNFFHLIATNDSNYTEVECYLSPDEYERLDGNALVKYNGDLYHVASVDAYDPTFRNKTKLKLIRRTS